MWDPQKPRVPWELEGSLWITGVQKVLGCAAARCIPWSLPETLTAFSFLFSVLHAEFHYQAIDGEETTEILNCQQSCEQGNYDFIETCFLIYQEERRSQIRRLHSEGRVYPGEGMQKEMGSQSSGVLYGFPINQPDVESSNISDWSNN